MNLANFKEALVTIYDADSAVQAITGRTSLNLALRGAQIYDDNLPIATYLVLPSRRAGGITGRALIDVRIEVWVDMNKSNAIDNAETLMDRAEQLFNGPNLVAQGIDAAVNPIGQRRDGPAADGVISLARDFSFDLTVQ